MEADWSMEVGPELPRMDVPWEGFVDLRVTTEGLAGIPEAAGSPAMADALTTLNRQGSPIFTSKSDLWSMEQSEIDPDEFAALPEDAVCGAASYIDVIERDAESLASFAVHESWARRVVEELRQAPFRNGRVDLVIRAATVDGQEGYAMTLYAAGCGADAGSAFGNWEAVLGTLVPATMRSCGGAPSLPRDPNG